MNKSSSETDQFWAIGSKLLVNRERGVANVLTNSQEFPRRSIRSCRPGDLREHCSHEILWGIMDSSSRHFRSVLYIPASNARATEKAKSLPVDAIIFDLEDAVAVDEKPTARLALATVLKEGGFGHRAILVRINGLATPWWREDLEALEGIEIDGILLPKVSGSGDIDELAPYLPNVPVWAMMETPIGILNAVDAAAHPRIAGFVMGTNDLAKDMGTRDRADRLPLMTSLQTCLVAAKASGIVCIDGVYNAFRDQDGLRIESEQGRDLGFDGKTVVHPAQVEIANEVFSPSPEEIELARRQIAAFEVATIEGQGVAVVDGQIVENLHIEAARALIAKAASVEALVLE